MKGDKQMNGKFWAIWRKTGGAPPQKRHETKEAAIKEAMRLVRQTGEEYYILEATGIMRVRLAPVEYVPLTPTLSLDDEPPIPKTLEGTGIVDCGGSNEKTR